MPITSAESAKVPKGQDMTIAYIAINDDTTIHGIGTTSDEAWEDFNSEMVKAGISPADMVNGVVTGF